MAAPAAAPVACTSQAALVECLVASGCCSSARVTEALQRVDRRLFVPKPVLKTQHRHLYQMGKPLPIGHGQFTSAPQVHAQCLDLLQDKLQPGGAALDAGAGCGYVSACMSLLVGAQGRVVAVEKIPELAQACVANIGRCLPELLEGDRLRVVAGNALEGRDVLPSGQQFDAIHVGAAIDEVPEPLVALLKPGGRMVLPYGPRWASQVLMVVDKDQQGACHIQELQGEVQCVPLWRPAEMEDGFNDAGSVVCAMHLQLHPVAPAAAESR